MKANYYLCFLSRKCAVCKVMFSQASVILFTGGVSARHPPLSRHPPGQTHSPWADTPTWADTLPLGRHPHLGRHPLGRHPPGRHPQQTATAADGTHLTGMHSLFSILPTQGYLHGLVGRWGGRNPDSSPKSKSSMSS